MKVISHLKFWAGIGIILIVFLSYFVKISVDSGTNYVVESSLLGTLIFHNAFILGLYILVSVSLIISGLQFKNKQHERRYKK